MHNISSGLSKQRDQKMIRKSSNLCTFGKNRMEAGSCEDTYRLNQLTHRMQVL